MRVQLINAPMAALFCPSIRAGAFPPLHLATLASFVRNKTNDVEIELLDGELTETERIVLQLDADLVGISCNSLTYDSALRIAKMAKQMGAVVVLGGAHPTFAGYDILKNRDYVDYVVCGDGEYALLGLVQNMPPSEIPNLVYRENGQIRQNREAMLPLSDLPLPDFSGLLLQQYHQNYRSLYADKPFSSPSAAYSAKGCQWRDRSGGGCTFCAIQHAGFRIKPPDRYWSELLETSRHWAFDFYWDVSDTFTMQRDWVRAFAKSKPREANIQFQVYGRSTDVDAEMAELLAQIGVYETFLGIESGSNETLRASRKGITVRASREAIRHLNRSGVRVVISIVLGLPGESEATLAATRAMVDDIVSCSDLSEINCSILLPLPGSRSMSLLRQSSPVTKGAEDLFDPEFLRTAWVEQQCKVSYDRLVEVQGEMRELHWRVGTFGLTRSEAAVQQYLPVEK